jgi:hypothetical protein
MGVTTSESEATAQRSCHGGCAYRYVQLRIHLKIHPRLGIEKPRMSALMPPYLRVIEAGFHNAQSSLLKRYDRIRPAKDEPASLTCPEQKYRIGQMPLISAALSF